MFHKKKFKWESISWIQSSHFKNTFYLFKIYENNYNNILFSNDWPWRLLTIHKILVAFSNSLLLKQIEFPGNAIR